MRTTLIVAMAVWMTACGGGTKQVRPTEQVGPTDEKPTTAAYWELEPGAGVVVAEEQGGVVPMRVVETGETVTLADGEPVVMRQLFAGEGLGRAEAQIVARDQTGVVPNPRVAVAHRLMRVPGAPYAVLNAVSECSPKCVSDLWLLGRDGWRVQIASDATRVPTHIAVSPNGSRVAIGGHGLWVADVPDRRVRSWEAFTAPAYDPYGVLYVRGSGADDSVYEMGEFGNGVLIYTEPGTPPKTARDDARPDPAPITFAEDGKTLIATFVRRGETVERRIER